MSTALFDFIIPFIVVLGMLVFIHELGHYFAAKIFGMRVDAFSLGFPPRAWGFRWSSKRLRPKFLRDIKAAIAGNITFKKLYEHLHGKGLAGSIEDAMEMIDSAFEIEQEVIETEIINKRGKTEKKEEIRTHVRLAVSGSKIPADIIGIIEKDFTSDADLVSFFIAYSEIHDEKTFQEKYTTDYCLSWIPLGGYCKINGMIDESLDPDSMKEGNPKPWEYRAKPIWQRIIVITGGVIFNFLLAGIIFALMGWFNGLPDIDKYKEYKLGTEIGSVMPESPAEKAGLKSGDKILSISNHSVNEWKELVEIIHSNPEKSITVEWQRNSETMKAEITPRRSKIQTIDGTMEVGQIGIGPPQLPEFVREASVGEAVAWGFGNMAFMTGYMLKSIKQMIVGEASFKESMGGPVAIFRMTGEVKQQQGWEGIWNFMALLSISLAVFNLFPIPALDGGHLVFLFIEGIIRRPLSIKVKLYTQQIGMALLLTFIAYVIFNDITRWTSSM
ncbi:RIP metalloprotease RseP [bacterium]|nr:RIP metalloprotease RseP [bacterium]